jgi:hypothetical protein
VFPDHFDHDWRAGSAERVFDAAIDGLRPGVTEIHVQPAIDTPEVRALGEYTQGWIDDLALVTGDDLRAPRGERCDAHRLPRTARRDARRLTPCASAGTQGCATRAAMAVGAAPDFSSSSTVRRCDRMP